MKEDIGLILLNTVNYYLNKVIDKTLIKVKYYHEKKFINGKSNTLLICSTVYNYLLYNLCFFFGNDHRSVSIISAIAILTSVLILI